MSRGEGIYPDVGRQVPAAGAHILLGQPNIFFVTVNAKDAVPWMADPVVQATLAGLWSRDATAWLVGYYLIMPDHLHLFCGPDDLHFGNDPWVEFWKRQFSRRPIGQSWAWQRKSFHHRMRNRIEYEEKLAYVRENPLVSKTEDWPYQGRIHELRWMAD
jgi:putative transposase